MSEKHRGVRGREHVTAEADRTVADVLRYQKVADHVLDGQRYTLAGR